MRRKRRDSHEEAAGHERWLVSYADFITLLFAFFTVLFATSERSLEKTQEFQESLKKYLIKAGSGMGGSESQINQMEKNREVIESPLPTYKSNRPQDIEVTEVTERQIEQILTRSERDKYLIDVFSDELGVRIVLRGQALFSEGRNSFKKEALPFFDRIAQIFKKIDRRLLIEGHVDEKFDNEKLGAMDLAQDRSLQLARYLAKVHSFPVQKMTIASFGSNRPLSTNSKNLNDRIEIVVLYEDAPI